MLNQLTGISYTDMSGNSIETKTQSDNIWFEFQGQNNIIEIEAAVEVKGKLRINIKGNNNRIKIDKNINFIGVCTINFIKDNIDLYIDESCRFDKVQIVAWKNAAISIGKGCTFGPDNHIYCHAFSKLIIQEDCMISSDIVFQTGDGHTIFDLETGLNINSDLNNAVGGYLDELTLCNHVWVGRRCFILGGATYIGEGTVIGAQSFVKGRFPNNVVIAGDPAKIIRRDIAWSRNPRTLDLSDCNGYINKTSDII